MTWSDERNLLKVTTSNFYGIEMQMGHDVGGHLGVLRRFHRYE